MGRKSGAIAWGIVIFAVVALLLAWQYLDYRVARRTLPAGMTLGGLPVEGMTRDQALSTLEQVFTAPVEVTYQDQELSLSPERVELRFNVEQTAADLDAALEARGGVDGFMAHVFRHPLDPVDVPVAVDYSPERLDGFLAGVAQQHDRPPRDPVPLPESLTFQAGQPGHWLDIEASRPRVAAALVSPVDRRVSLVVQTESAPPLSLSLLEPMVRALLNDHEGLIAGIFIKDLHSGEEMAINADVAYAGLSVLKIAIMEETYRVLDQPPNVETTKLLSETMTLSGNFTANLLLRDEVGGGNCQMGADNLTDSMRRLGLVNTFMANPYREELEGQPLALVACPSAEFAPRTISTPANTRTDISTNPDPYVQTTPLDMGLLLEMIYQCSRGGGALQVAYPGAFTVDECRQMIEWMSGNHVDGLIEAGVPEGTQVAHKHGWIEDTHGDAALVLTPGGDFVLVVFLCRPNQWLMWDEASPLMADIATATYNYFNPPQ